MADLTDYDGTVISHSHVRRRHRDRQRHSLEQLEGAGGPRVVVVAGDEMVIGRALEAHIRLDSQRVSRQHAFLRVRGTDCLLFDNDSRNGVLLNGVKVYSAVLRDGDLIQVADSVFVYSLG